MLLLNLCKFCVNRLSLLSSLSFSRPLAMQPGNVRECFTFVFEKSDRSETDEGSWYASFESAIQGNCSEGIQRPEGEKHIRKAPVTVTLLKKNQLMKSGSTVLPCRTYAEKTLKLADSFRIFGITRTEGEKLKLVTLSLQRSLNENS